MPSFVMRVWVPDRPGALGAVASRIGAVRGDLVGIDILERGGGRAVDELVVELPDEALVPLMIREVAQVDGVDVEDVRPGRPPGDGRVQSLETAAALVAEPDPAALVGTLARLSRADTGADWSAVVDAGTPVAAAGAVPPDAWMVAFVAGARVLRPASARTGHPAAGGSRGDGAPEDVAWAEMERAGLVLVLGRGGRPFRRRERHQVEAVARLADLRWSEVADRGPALLPRDRGR